MSTSLGNVKTSHPFSTTSIMRILRHTRIISRCFRVLHAK